MNNLIKIIIASVLKPVDDVRAFHKIGQSIAQTNKYEVNIIGFISKKNNPPKNIFFHPLFSFSRNSLKRILSGFKLIKIYIKVKPKLIIVNTPELLWVTYLIRILFGTKIIYDIRENYSLNLKSGSHNNLLLKPLLLLWLKLTEGVSKFFVDGYFLAEEVYQKQLNFMGSRPILTILNKTTLPLSISNNQFVQVASDKSIKMVYSGTIGRTYGTLEAILLCKGLHQINPNVTLIIIGYSADYKYLKGIKKAIKTLNYVELIGGDHLVPHAEIVQIINNADIALLPYEVNENFRQKIPTKFYEYLALKIPMLIPFNLHWEAFLDTYQASVAIDYKNFDPKQVLTQIGNKRFYSHQPSAEILWKNEEGKLLPFIDYILSK